MEDIVVYIDEDDDSRRVYGDLLRENLAGSVEVLPIEPEKTVQKTLENLRNLSGRIVSIVIDERLYAKGTADFAGTQFVEAYRDFDDKLPIYILTNHPDDIDEWFSGVEYILSKSDISDEDLTPKIFSKIFRHINIYNEIVDERTSRFRELIGKSIDDSLSASDAEELAELRRWRVMGILTVEEPMASHLKEKLDRKTQLIDSIDELLRKVGH